MRLFLLGAAVTLIAPICARAVCPVGDLSLDCKIDFEDIRLFGEQWLLETDCADPNHADPECPDMDGVDGVNIIDFALLTQHWYDVGHPIVINEFMASNSSFVPDPQNELDDWIELYNGGDEAIDVGGMYLTNKLSNPTKWQIPDDIPYLTTIPSHGYLWIWADEDVNESPGLHAGFTLDLEGDKIGLFDSDGSTLVDSISFGRQSSDVSFGRYPDGWHQWRFFGTPTPRARNEGAYLGEVEEPQFSHKRGFYSSDSPILVTVATETAGATIYYTLDGQVPYSESGGVVGEEFTSPITISNTRCLRAIAVRPGWKPSRIKTHTYIFDIPEEIKSLPIISLSGSNEETFYEPDGIMAIVGGYYSGGVWTSDGAGSYNNMIQRGMAYERPASFEFFNTADGWDLQEDCGVRVHGSEWMRPRYLRCQSHLPLGWTGDCKISFRLYFRSMYGKNQLDYRLFPYGLDRQKSIVIRGGHNDRENPFIKDELMRRLQLDMDNPASTGTMANLFINGLYKGYYNPCEHIKSAFCQEYYDSDYDWDVMTMSGIRDGDSSSWNALYSYARNNDLSNPIHYYEVSRRVDIPAFVDYLILQLWSGNWDWPSNNWSAASEHSSAGMWRFFIWDIEGGMFSDHVNTVYFDRLNSWSDGNSVLYRCLKNSDEFKQVFEDRLCRHFYNGGVMTAEHIETRFRELQDEMSEEIPAMDTYVVDTWVPSRRHVFFNACSNEGLFDYIGPEFNINGSYKHGGNVSVGDELSISNPYAFGTIYYTVDGNDPRVPAGMWSPGDMVTLVAADAAKHVLVPTEDLGSETGSILYERWTDIDGTAIADLTSHPDYPDNPDDSYYVSLFEGPSNWGERYGARISGYVHPPLTGDYTFWLATDDNGELWLSTDEDPANKQLIATVPSWTASRTWNVYPEQQSDSIQLTGGEKYYIEAMMKEHGGGDNIDATWDGPGVSYGTPIAGEYLSGPGNIWTTLGYDDSGWDKWAPGNTGVGYETRPGDAINYTDLIDVDVLSEMYNKHTTCYIRIPFNVETLDLMNLTLNIRYDDGFVAYINGSKVASRNFVGMPHWDSHSDTDHPDDLSISPEFIDLSEHLDTLRVGTNVLAIQGLNCSTGSSDFLIWAELLAYDAVSVPSGTISETAIEYTWPRPLTESAHVKARMLYNNVWSGLTEAPYSVGPVARNLRITEIMYHPYDGNDVNHPGVEFVELKNIGDVPISLNLVSFTNGIDFTFGDLDLADGNYVVVVEDIEAFNAAYPGFSGVIAGEYTGNLDNGGEKIELEDACGNVIHEFKYDDDWREVTDGDGYSLTVIDPNDMPSYGLEGALAANWKLDDGSGQTALDSVGANHGTVWGNAAWDITGGWLEFDGIDDYISLSPVEPLSSGSVTVEAWVRLPDTFIVFNPIVTQHDSTGDGYYLYLFEGTPAFYLACDGLSKVAYASSPEIVEANRWYHIAGTNDGSELRIYIDGYLKDSASSAGLSGIDCAAYIGYDSITPTYFNGWIDDIRIHNRALREEDFGDVIDPLRRWGRKSTWRASAYAGGSPGRDDSGIVPNPGAVVTSEIMAHSHDTAPDWIELYNTTNEEIDIGGWYISDSNADLMKYRIADGTKLDAYSYIVFYEDANFGESGSDPGRLTGFAFNENGDKAYLSSGGNGPGDTDVLTGYRHTEDFGASERGVSFGRYGKTSTDSYNFVAMDHNTPGRENGYPQVGPIVINEIMYNPDWPVGGMYTNNQYEYIELHNITDGPVLLYDNDADEPWKFTDGVDYKFPGKPGLTMPPHSYLLIVKNITAYLTRYGLPPSGVLLLGPYDGKLSDGGEKLELSKPGDVDEFGQRSYIRVDRVNYSDGSYSNDTSADVNLWPTEPDGTGASLSRIWSNLYGNDPNNWKAGTPSPGQVNP